MAIETPKNSFMAYSGTTLQIYRICAVIENGVIQFWKSLEPMHHDEAIFYIPDLNSAAVYAVRRAIELGHNTPLVMGGMLSELYKGTQELPVGFHFPVCTVFIPKRGANFDDSDVYRGDITDKFEEKRPSDMLNT